MVEESALTKLNPLNWRTPEYNKTVTDDTAVSQVSWNDAVAFCNWLSEHEKLPVAYRKQAKNLWELDPAARGYRLPTEAEWEYACRGGTSTQYSFGDDVNLLANFGWYQPNNGGNPNRVVGRKPPNAVGLCDMHGNMQEWCHDWYEEKRYEANQFNGANDPTGPVSNSTRVIRGGNWYYTACHCRSASRTSSAPPYRDNSYGCRPVRGW